MDPWGDASDRLLSPRTDNPTPTLRGVSSPSSRSPSLPPPPAPPETPCLRMEKGFLSQGRRLGWKEHEPEVSPKAPAPSLPTPPSLPPLPAGCEGEPPHLTFLSGLLGAPGQLESQGGQEPPRPPAPPGAGRGGMDGERTGQPSPVYLLPSINSARPPLPGAASASHSG